MSKFNLIEEPWIPCLTADNKMLEFNLFDVLTKAHEIKEIVDNSPLVVVSLHRLLLAILHRNFGPKNFEEWKDLWRKGSWDEEKLKTYFDKWKERFNLFDDERPFYQYPKVAKKGGEEADIEPLELLMQEKAAGANATLFDHSFEANPKSYVPSIAARYLIARQAFSIGFGRSYPFYLSDSSIIRGITVLALGNNLFETLTLNLIVYYRNKPIQIQEDDEGNSLDKPVWERLELVQAGEKDSQGTSPLGYLDYLTWQSRRIKLIPDSDLQSIPFCQLQQNFKFANAEIFDPFKSYQIDQKDGWSALSLVPDKALWRDSHTLFQQSKSTSKQAEVFNHLAKIGRDIDGGEIEGNKTYAFSVFGMATEKGKAASVIIWTQERLPLPLDYLNDSNLLEQLNTAIQFSEEIAREVLKSSLNKLAWELQPDIAGKERGEKARKMADGFTAMPIFWSSLEVKFKKLLVELPSEKEKALSEWFSFVNEMAKYAFDKTANSLSGSAAEQKAIVKAENSFYYERRKILNNNSIYREFLSDDKTKKGEV